MSRSVNLKAIQTVTVWDSGCYLVSHRKHGPNKAVVAVCQWLQSAIFCSSLFLFLPYDQLPVQLEQAGALRSNDVT